MVIAERRAGVGFVVLVVCIALAALGSSAPVSQAATTCSNQTVDGGRFVGKVTLRVVLIGRVSCERAHRVVRAYYRKMAAGGCGQLNNFCALSFPGGWSCSIFSFGVSQTAGGAGAGCARAAPAAKIRLYKTAGHRRTRHLAQFLSTDRQVWCVIGRASAFCAAGPPPDPGTSQPPQYGATLKRDGTVTTCAVPTPGAVATCAQNWNFGAPILPLGRRNKRGGVVCRARPTGITCKLAAGPAKGKGFWISATGVSKVRATGARARAAATARGTILDAVSRQTVSQDNGDGTVTRCEVVGGVLRTERGESVTFAAGGVLAPDLAPQARATVDTIEQAARQGRRLVATITYVDSQTLCGYPLAHFVTSASVAAAPPAQQPTAQPQPQRQPSPAPAPVTLTAFGTITRMSPLGALVGTTTAGGVVRLCRVWPGQLTTTGGQTIDFYVTTGLTGSLAAGELNPTDPAAVQRAKALHEAAGLGRRASVRISYVASAAPCGASPRAVVTAADVKVPQKTRKLRGRIQDMFSPDVFSADGTSCKVWLGRLITRSGKRVPFHLATVVSGFSLRGRDPRAARIAKKLRKARRTRARTTITTSGPVYACGDVLPSVVTKASVRKRT